MSVSEGVPRADLLGLTDDILADLTNRGTVRRARREVEENDPPSRLDVREDGTVVVESDDARCELLADRAFADWPCTCLVGGSCRHVVRAVLAYRRSLAPDAGTAPGEPEPLATPEAPIAAQPGTAQHGAAQHGAAEPGRRIEVSDAVLAAALSAPAIRRAAQAAARGVLGIVTHGEITVVRLFHPLAVTVRFLQGHDLRYVRCDCTEADPCWHVGLAVRLLHAATADSVPAVTSGLIELPGDQWRPDPGVLDAVCAALTDLIDWGADVASTVMRSRLDRLAGQAREAELFTVADVVDDVGAELARYAHVDAGFSVDALVDLVGEAWARTTSLRLGRVGRVPDRLVAGSSDGAVPVGPGRLVGLGTEVIEHARRVQVRALAVDPRSAAAVAVAVEHGEAPGSERLATSHLAERLVGGIAVRAWGGGQVLTTGGVRTTGATFRPARRRASALPASDVGELGAPWALADLAAVASAQTRLPAALDQRVAGTGLAACRIVEIGDVGFDRAAQTLTATLIDRRGATARLELPYRDRNPTGLDRGATWLHEHEATPSWVAGRWRFTPTGSVVVPTLLAGPAAVVQPQIDGAAAVTGADLLGVAGPVTLGAADAVGSLLQEVGATLGTLLVAGRERLGRDEPGRAAGLADRLQAAGASEWAALVRDGSATAIAQLAMTLVLARPLA